MAYEEPPVEEQADDHAAPRDRYGHGKTSKFHKKEGYGHGLRGRRSAQEADALDLTAEHRNRHYSGGYGNYRGGSGYHHRGSHNTYPRGYGYISG